VEIRGEQQQQQQQQHQTGLKAAPALPISMHAANV
jgi:hypothetical protein